MKIEKHYEKLKESLEVIDECITAGVLKRQRTIGFSCSSAACDMLEIFLHKRELIDQGLVVKHDWFSSKNRLKEKFSFEFEKKEEILTLMHEIESKRNDFCYGSPKEEKEISLLIIKFNRLKEIFNELGVNVEQ